MTSPSKFFSAALEAAEKLTQKSGTREQMRAMLEKYGAKPSELDYIGIPKFLADKPKVTRQELLDYIDANQVKPEEVLKRGGAASSDQQELMRDVADALVRAHSANAEEAAAAKAEYTALTGNMWEPSIFQLSRATPDDLSRYGSATTTVGPDLMARIDHERDAAYQAAFSDVMPYTKNGGVKWDQYTSKDPSMDYTEHLVTLPASKDAVGKLTPGPNPKWVDADYMSPHWSEPNVLAHMRYDYDPDALRLEELQSDWLQQGRKYGFRWTGEESIDKQTAIYEQEQRYKELYNKAKEKYGSNDSFWPTATHSALAFERNKLNDLTHELNQQKIAVPRAPLANVNDWTGMLVRRALLDAAEKDMKKLRLTSGEMQDSRYSPQPGRVEYYDKIIPNIVNKYLKPFGSKMERGPESYPYPVNINRIQGSLPAYWESDIPDELKRRLLQKGKVPFFKNGGAVR